MKSYKKIYNYYLDLMFKDKKVFWDYNGLDSGYLLSDSYIISIVPEMYLNQVKIPKVNLEKFIESLKIEDYKEASKIVLISSDNLIGLKHGDIEVLISNKYYNLYKGCTFKIISDIKPVLIYDNDKIIGFILPVKKY